MARYRGSSSKIGCLPIILGLGLIFAIIQAVARLLTGAAESATTTMSEYPTMTTLVLLSVGGSCAAIFVRAKIKSKRTAEFMRGVEDAAANLSLLVSQETALTALRQSAEPLPFMVVAHAERLYRRLIQDIVSDCQLTDLEQRGLEAFERVIAISSDAKSQVRRAGFLRAVELAVADGVLTAAEDAGLNRIREVFQIDADAVKDLLALQDQLRRAQSVRTEPLCPISCDIKVRRTEICYWQGEATEQMLKAAGKRHSGKQVQDLRAGTLYLTSERFLFVGNGSLSIPISNMLDLEVTEDKAAVTVISDKRKSPYRFKVNEPYVLVALAEKVSTAEPLATRNLSSVESAD